MIKMCTLTSNCKENIYYFLAIKCKNENKILILVYQHENFACVFKTKEFFPIKSMTFINRCM